MNKIRAVCERLPVPMQNPPVWFALIVIARHRRFHFVIPAETKNPHRKKKKPQRIKKKERSASLAQKDPRKKIRK